MLHAPPGRHAHALYKKMPRAPRARDACTHAFYADVQKDVRLPVSACLSRTMYYIEHLILDVQK